MHIPTPCCMDAGGGYGDNPRSCTDPEGRTFRGVSLAYLVNHPELYWNREKYPTPIAHDRLGAMGPNAIAQKDGKTRMDQLATFVKYKDSYPTPMAGSSRCSNGSGAFSGNDFGESRLKQHLQNFVPYVLEGKDPVDTGRYDEAMDFIQKEREKHGKVQLADTDSK